MTTLPSTPRLELDSIFSSSTNSHLDFDLINRAEVTKIGTGLGSFWGKGRNGGFPASADSGRKANRIAKIDAGFRRMVWLSFFSHLYYLLQNAIPASALIISTDEQEKTMTNQIKTAPNEIDETTLDEISGGPHFRNFHGASFDFQSGCDTVLSTNTETSNDLTYEMCDPIFRSA